MGQTEIAANINQNSIGNCLSRETGSPSAKRQRNLLVVTECKKLSDLFCVDRLHDGLRNQTIKAAIGGKGDSIDLPGKDARWRDECPQLRRKLIRRR